MFSEYYETRENSDAFSWVTDMLDDNDNGYNKGPDNKKNPGQPNFPEYSDKSEKEPESEKESESEKGLENKNLEEARNRAIEWYKVLSNAYPGGFEINQNWNELTKISFSKSLTGFSIRVSRIQKEHDKETTIDSWVLNFENIFPQNIDNQGWDQSGTAQTDKNPTPSFSITWNNALLSQLFQNPEWQNKWWLDIANQDFCSLVDALWNNESVIAKKVEAAYWFATNYLQKFRDRYIKEDLKSLAEINYNFNKIDTNDKLINVILDDSGLDDSSLLIRKALLSSCILLRSRNNTDQSNAIKQALWIVDNLKKTAWKESGSLTSWEEMIDLLRERNRTPVVYIISNSDTLVEGAKSCINWDSNMKEDMKNQILNLLNKQND